MSDPNEPETHSGVLRASEHHSAELFEFGGHKLQLKGTSGRPAEPSRMAEGRPVGHDVALAGQTSAAPTSGTSHVEARTAAGHPVQHSSSSQEEAEPISELKGSGQLTGQPVRRV